MRTLRNFFFLSLLGVGVLHAQTPLVNFDFNSGSNFPYPANTTLTGVTCTLTSNTTFTLGNGIAITDSAFFQNSQGTALGILGSAGTESSPSYYLFSVGGSNLYNYENYHLYFQTNRGSLGALTLKVEYSTNGTDFTSYRILICQSLPKPISWTCPVYLL